VARVADVSARTWIGFDPSIASFGYAVMNRQLGGQPVVLEMGTFKTKLSRNEPKLEDRARRVRELIENVARLLDEHRPSEAYVESLAFGMNTSRMTSSVLGRVRGTVEALCFDRKIELAEIRPEVVKQAIVGRKDADKETVARFLRRAYQLSGSASYDLDATDALAVAHVGTPRFGHGVTISSGVVQFRPPTDDDLNLD
jgi:crossover junction endodeoxyribonuclease RuvC